MGVYGLNILFLGTLNYEYCIYTGDIKLLKENETG